VNKQFISLKWCYHFLVIDDVGRLRMLDEVKHMQEELLEAEVWLRVPADGVQTEEVVLNPGDMQICASTRFITSAFLLLEKRGLL
jgi:hypothetical protein